MHEVWLIAAVAAAAAVITGAARWASLRADLMDLPNERSSHAVPAPRGGGVAIVICFLAPLPFLAAEGFVDWPLVLALLIGGGLTAVTGLVDDLRSLRAGTRLALHFAAAGLGLYLVGGLPPISFGAEPVDLGWPGHVFAWIGLVWLLNLFNFMDGINGVAGAETVTVGLGAALLILSSLAPGALPPLLLAAASAGFLVWNFPKARIFMGDVGSGFLGLVLGLMTIHLATLLPSMLWAMLVLVGCFVVDATFTLAVRMLHGKRPHEAHRSHAYQIAARRFGSHAPVTISIAVINLVWLLPVAGLIVTGTIAGPLALLAAYAPLVAVAVYFGAGAEVNGRKPSLHDTDTLH